MADQLNAYDELYAYAMGRPAFILQHVVDAFGAQSATDRGKPIRLVFSLIGLYLRVEKRFSGTAVQKVHMRLGRGKSVWPPIPLPLERGEITAVEVMQAPAGAARDEAIDAWCRSVWSAFAESRQAIVDLLRAYDVS